MTAPDRAKWTPLHAQLHRTLRQRQLLPPHASILIAVSGGQDSVCLAQLLVDLQPKWGWKLAIAHCDHRWRTDSEANATYVQHLAQSWGLPDRCCTADRVATSEAAARHWRYQMLADMADAEGARYIVTGHTQTDRAETFVYNLIRGTGTDGLQSLTWTRPLVPGIELVRPLLEIGRDRTEQFCQQQGLQIWEDSTNQDLKYARNRIRQELFPYLRTHFNPQAEAAIARTAEILRAEVEYLEAQAGMLLEKALAKAIEKTREKEVTTSGDQSVEPKLDRQILRQAPLALQRRAVRQFLSAILPHATNAEQIEKLAALIHAPNRSRTDPFPGGAIAEVDGNWIVLRCH
jgi:tRNA(Ile)-lysidine synthase